MGKKEQGYIGVIRDANNEVLGYAMKPEIKKVWEDSLAETPNIDPERLDAWIEDSLKRRDGKYARMESINAEMLEALEEVVAIQEKHRTSARLTHICMIVLAEHARAIIAKAKGEKP